MANPGVVLLVKFKSALSLEEVIDVVNSRIDQFKALAGLTQKYYLQDAATGEFAGLYLWESADALSAFQKSELSKTIAGAYQTLEPPRIEAFRILETLRD